MFVLLFVAVFCSCRAVMVFCACNAWVVSQVPNSVKAILKSGVLSSIALLFELTKCGLLWEEQENLEQHMCIVIVYSLQLTAN